MKTISKILYGLISFSVFAAYKIETAWAGWKVALVSYASSCGDIKSTVRSILDDATFAMTGKTICDTGKILTSCGAGDSFAYTNLGYTIPNDFTLQSLAYSCRDISFCIDACDDGAPIEGVIMPATILKVPMQGNYSTEYYVDICDTDTLTSLLNSVTYGDTDADLIAKGDQMLLAPLPDGAEPMLQQYRIWYETEARDWISINDKSYCEQKAGESQMQSGILYRSEDCPFIYS